MVGSLNDENKNLELTLKALKQQQMADHRYKAKKIEAAIAEHEEKEAEEELESQTRDLELAEATGNRVSAGDENEDVEQMQREAAEMARTEELVEVQTRGLKADMMEKAIAVQKIEVISARSKLDMRQNQVETRLQMAQISSQRVPDAIGIQQAIDMLSAARPAVQTRQARIIIDTSKHELQQALESLSEIERRHHQVQELLAEVNEDHSIAEEQTREEAGPGAPPQPVT
jgi:hypothetical protein